MTTPGNKVSKPSGTGVDDQNLDHLRKRYFVFLVVFQLAVGVISSLSGGWVGLFVFVFLFLLASLGVVTAHATSHSITASRSITTFSERTCKLLTLIFVCGQSPFLFLRIFGLKLGPFFISDEVAALAGLSFFFLTFTLFIVLGSSAKALLKQRKNERQTKSKAADDTESTNSKTT